MNDVVKVTNNMPLEINNTKKYYGSLLAVDNVSFNVESGDIFGLLGPNGAGKTSIISMIAGLEKISSGKIKIFGKDVSENNVEAKRLFGIVPQEFINMGYFSVKKILKFYSGYYGFPNNDKRVEFLLKKLELWNHKDKLVKTLSGGMKKRFMMAKAMLHNPQLLILDEPSVGVDIELRKKMLDFIKEINKEGVSILLTTHYLHEAEELCNKIGIINKGKLSYLGSCRSFIDNLTSRRVDIYWKKAKTFVNSSYLIKHEGIKSSFYIPSSLNIEEIFIDSGLNIDEVVDIRIVEGNLEIAFTNYISKKSI